MIREEIQNKTEDVSATLSAFLGSPSLDMELRGTDAEGDAQKYWMISIKDSVFVLECGPLNPQEHVHYCSLLEELTMGLKQGKN